MNDASQMRIGRVIAIGASYVAAYALGALMASGLALVLGERAPARAEASGLAAAPLALPTIVDPRIQTVGRPEIR